MIKALPTPIQNMLSTGLRYPRLVNLVAVNITWLFVGAAFSVWLLRTTAKRRSQRLTWQYLLPVSPLVE